LHVEFDGHRRAVRDDAGDAAEVVVAENHAGADLVRLVVLLARAVLRDDGAGNAAGISGRDDAKRRRVVAHERGEPRVDLLRGEMAFGHLNRRLIAASAAATTIAAAGPCGRVRIRLITLLRLVVGHALG